MNNIEPDRLRQVLGHIPSSVAVVTANSADGPLGSMVSTVNSVSLDPPLISFCVRRTHPAWSSMTTLGDVVGVNILAADQRDEYAALTAGASALEYVPWAPAEHGLAQVTNSLVWMVGEVATAQPVGDHTLVIARVDVLEVLRDTDPMVASVAAVRSSFWDGWEVEAPVS